MSILLYLSSLYFFYTTYLLRQAIAVSFGNLAIIYHLNDKRIKSTILICIALTFHFTAIVLIPILLIPKNINTKKVYFTIILVGFISMNFQFIVKYILPKIPYVNKYIGSEIQNQIIVNNNYKVILKGIPYFYLTILGIIYSKKLKSKTYIWNFCLLSSALYSISWLLSIKMYWIFRVGWYYLLPTLSLIPNIINLTINKNKKILIYLSIIFLLLIVTFRQIFITLNS